MTSAPALRQALDAFNSGDLDQARDLAERALELAPSPQLQHLVGLIHCRLGNAAEGVGWLRKASESEPDNVGFRVMLVRALVDAGRPEEALQAASLPPGTGRLELGLWHARAEAAVAAGDIAAAIEAWGVMCRASVRDWRAWANYGNALAAAERWSEAEAAYRRAMEIDPREPTIRRDLAIACIRQARENEAADELLKWSEEALPDAEGRLVLARLLADLGRETEAFDQLKKVVAASGRSFDPSGAGLVAATATAEGEVRISLLIEIARLLERTNRIDGLRKLIEEGERAGIERERLGYPAAALALRDGHPEDAKRLLELDKPYSDPLRGHRLMARIADALGDSETAFAEAEAMNASVDNRDQWLAKAAEYIRAVRSVTKTVTPNWAARLRPLEPPKRGSPVFLVGFPRSGTTLLDTFLMGHPDTLVLEEVPLMTEAQKSLGRGPELPDRSAAELERARDAYFEALDRHVPKGFGGLVIDKLPLNLLAARMIYTLFPDARIVYAQRHPCDSVLSCFMQPFALTDSMACFLKLDTATDFYDATLSFWSRCEELLPLNVHRVVYERLVDDPESELRRVVDFLGLEWRAELLDHRATAHARGVITTPSYDQVVQPVSKLASGRWRRYERQLQPVLPVLLRWAERLGYCD